MAGQAKPPVRGARERNALALKWLDLVPWAIYERWPHLRRVARLLGHQDAVQEGRIALLRAAEVWEPEACSFSTYAARAIRWRLMRLAGQALGKERGGEMARHDLGDCHDRETLPRAGGSAHEIQEVIGRVLKTLTHREAEVVRLRYGLQADAPYTLDEVGRILKVTRERVRQIEARAVRKLQQPQRARVLAAAAGLHACGLCGRWTECNLACPLCRKQGCPACVCLRAGKEGLRSCGPCLKKRDGEPAAAVPPGWESYPAYRHFVRRFGPASDSRQTDFGLTGD